MCPSVVMGVDLENVQVASRKISGHPAAPRPRPASRMSTPIQERSRQSLDRMLVALEDLLKNQSFEKITIAALARRADVAVGSIYARFADKQALLIGMHQRIHERSEPCRRKLVDPATWLGRSTEAVLKGTIFAAIRYYRQHGKVLRAVNLNQPAEVTVRVRTEIQEFSIAMANLLATKAAVRNRVGVHAAVESAVGIVVAVLMHRTAPPGERIVGMVTEQRLAAELLTVVRALLQPVLEPLAPH